VSDKLLTHTKHSKHALLHLLDLGILPLSEAVKQASKPVICCDTVMSCLLLKLYGPPLLHACPLSAAVLAAEVSL
jgi:hypothetical protein